MKQASNPDLTSRRAFLKCAGAATAAAATILLVDPPTAAAEGTPVEPAGEEALGVLIDLTRCSGCNSCALACKAANRLPLPNQAPTELDSDNFTFIDTRTTANGTEVHVKKQCMQCVHPACVSACTVGALRKTAEGPVVYDSSKCIGCRYCQYACPFNIPTYQWDNTFGLIQKCQMCYQRLAAGQQPACVAACPNGALKFGNRAELLAQAHATIDANQGHYLDHVYGEHEVGGTSMLYLSAVPFDQLGLPVRDDSPSPHYAEAVMQMTPVVALSVASLATGLHLILRRRHMLAEQRAAEATQPQTKGTSHDR